MINTNNYLASKDTRRFNENQTKAEQYEALGTLDYYRDILGPGGQLVELREAILNEGETIPGRTSDESLQMVNVAISTTIKWMNFDIDERMKRTIKLTIMSFAALILLASMPFLLHWMLNMTHQLSMYNK